jgi:hypothetical protein
MPVFPLSALEERTVRWATRIVPAVTILLTIMLTAISIAAAQG